MANKKKRNKHYKGPGAVAHTTFTKVSAVKRHPLVQWWVDHRRMARPIGMTALIAFGVLIIIIGIVSILAGSH